MNKGGLAKAIIDFIETERQKKIAPTLAKIETAQSKKTDQAKIAALEDEVIEKSAPFEVTTYLSKMAKLAKFARISTHVAKFTHANAEEGSFYSWNYQDGLDYLCTDSTPELLYDASGSAGYSKCVYLFNVRDESGNSFYDAIKNGDHSALKELSTNDTQLDEWINGFTCAAKQRSAILDKLLKQVYYPVGPDNYHLLVPIFASSLAHKLFAKMDRFPSRYPERAAAAKAYYKREFSEQPHVVFPNTVSQFWGGSQPQNVSPLNSKRSGGLALLRCAPPVCGKVIKPPVQESSIIQSDEFQERSGETYAYFRQYLTIVKNCDSTLPMRVEIIRYVEDLASSLLNFAADIQNLRRNAGWSALAPKLSDAEKLWLDPWCQDPDFQTQRARGYWKAEIIEMFASWLNQKLNADLNQFGMLFGDVQHGYWVKLFTPLFTDYEYGTQVYVSTTMEANV